jgi:ubiquinone biosynthesis protein COQ9
MKSPLAESDRDRLIEAILPDVPFDGWSMAALRNAARRCGIDESAARALFPRGAPDLVAAFSRWADHRMLERLEAARLDELSTAPRIRLAIHSRFGIVAPWREAVRSSLAVLALPPHAVLASRLLYETVDGMWYAAGDKATDFSFYTKRATLAGLYAAALVYWLDDRSEGFGDTTAFVDRRLDDLRRVGDVRARFDEFLTRLPDPFRFFRATR